MDPLKGASYIIYEKIKAGQGHSPRDLSEHTGYALSTVYLVLRKLEEAEYIKANNRLPFFVDNYANFNRPDTSSEPIESVGGHKRPRKNGAVAKKRNAHLAPQQNHCGEAGAE